MTQWAAGTGRRNSLFSQFTGNTEARGGQLVMRCGVESLLSVLSWQRLRWCGHIKRRERRPCTERSCRGGGRGDGTVLKTREAEEALYLKFVLLVVQPDPECILGPDGPLLKLALHTLVGAVVQELDAHL